MKKRLSDRDLAEKIANMLNSDEDKARHPDLNIRNLLQRARDAGSGTLRAQHVEHAQREIAKLNPARHGRLINQLQSEVLALQGRRGDTEVAHLTRGELVVPRALQNPEVLWALRRAAAAYNIPLEMLSVGNAMNRINPNTGTPEFGVMDWISGLFGQDDAQDRTAAGQGLAARAASTGITSGNIRRDYIDKVQALDPYDNDGRAALKAQERAISPPEVRDPLNKFYPDLGPKPGSVGRANVPNPGANAMGRAAGILGRGLVGVNAAVAAADIATSNNPARAAVANAGSFGGGLLGGAVGAGLGGMTGPAAFVAAPAGAITGSALGGAYGYKAGEHAYDYIDDFWNKSF
jgi:hypothetical protein